MDIKKVKRIQIYQKRRDYIIREYKRTLVHYKHLEDPLFIQWVNKVQIALIFYNLHYMGKIGYFRKKEDAMSGLSKFEDHNRIRTDIFETAERMFL